MSWPTTQLLHLPVPPAPPASKRTQLRTSGFYTKYLYQILLYCTEQGTRPPAAHRLFYSLPTTHPAQVTGKVKHPTSGLPTNNKFAFFPSLKPAVLCVFFRVYKKKDLKKKDLGRRPINQ